VDRSAPEALSNEARWLSLAGMCVVAALAFVTVTASAAGGELAGVDRAVRAFAMRHQWPFARGVMHVLTQFGAKELIGPLAAVIGWRMFRDNRAWLVLLVYAVFASAEAAGVVKRDLLLARPEGGVEAGMGFGFPSGHAAGSAGLAITLCYLAVRRRFHPRLVAGVALPLLLLVAVSRVYLDLHWVSDTLGGWALGATVGVGCCALYEWVERRADVAAQRALPPRT
jgi:undecaprenyl-diphosphatase